MSDDLHMPLKFGEAGPEIQRLREENQHIRGAYEDCRAQWTQMATHNAQQSAQITHLRARVAELEGLTYGLMLAMSASRYDFAEILKEARATATKYVCTLEGKKE